MSTQATTLADDEKALAGTSSKGAGEAEPGLAIYRAARPEEISALKDIVQTFHAESRYAHIPFSTRKFIRGFSKAISNPKDVLALYVQYKGETVGLLHAGAGDYYLGEGGRMVTIYAIYVSKKLRNTLLGGKIALRLIRIAFDWAKSQQAQELHIHVTAGIAPKQADKLLTRLGFETYGGNYVGRVG